MQVSENFIGRASISTTPTENQPLANEWGKKWGKINGNVQFWAFLFFVYGKENRRVSQRTCKPNKPNEKRFNPRLLLVFYLFDKPDYGD